jgi:hypothetical protein
LISSRSYVSITSNTITYSQHLKPVLINSLGTAAYIVDRFGCCKNL